ISLAVLTDSTTAQASPALTCRPTAGNSTNTTSVNSCCAWSVMPTVATLPETRTHSCVFAYFKSEGMFSISQLRQGPGVRSIRFSIDRLRHQDRRGAFAANLDLDGRIDLGKLRRHIAHPDANAERRALRAAHDFADFRCARASAPDWIVRTRRCRPVRHLKRHELLVRALGLLLGQYSATDELAFVQRDEEAHARLDRGGVFVQFVAVKRVANLRAQRVARAQPGRFQPVGLARDEQLMPDRLDVLARCHDLKPILAGVAGARNPDCLAGQFKAGHLVLLQIRHARHLRAARGRTGAESADELHHARALHGHSTRRVRGVLELHLAAPGERGELLLQPRYVGVDAGSVADEQVFAGGEAVGVKIIDDAAALVAHQGILTLAGRQFAEVVRSEEHTSELQSRQYLVCRL